MMHQNDVMMPQNDVMCQIATFIHQSISLSSSHPMQRVANREGLCQVEDGNSLELVYIDKLTQQLILMFNVGPGFCLHSIAKLL